ncbi:hypothetical protein [uncultured Mediterranean phage]|nr:hypothetical protein [uncultured Mediterranean phage]
MRALFLRFFTWLTRIDLAELNARPIPLPDLEDQLVEVNDQLRTLGDWENYCPDDFDSRIAELEGLDHSAKFEEIEATTESQMDTVAEMLEMVHNQAVTTSTVDSQISEHLHGYCTEEDLADLDTRITNLDNTNNELIEKLYEASKCLSRAANLMALGSG